MTQGSSAKSYSLVAAFLVLACLVTIYVIFSKYWNEYTLAKAQYTNTQFENDRLKKALHDSESYLETYENEAGNIEKLSMALPEEDSDMANFISSLSQLATQSSVSLNSFSVATVTSTVPAENAIGVEEITFNVSGSYPAFKDFLNKLQQHLRIVDIYHVTLSSAGSEGVGTPVLQYAVKLRTYYQK
jgi:Tfp pilus assembly protein PilO